MYCSAGKCIGGFVLRRAEGSETSEGRAEKGGKKISENIVAFCVQKALHYLRSC